MHIGIGKGFGDKAVDDNSNAHVPAFRKSHRTRTAELGSAASTPKVAGELAVAHSAEITIPVTEIPTPTEIIAVQTSTPAHV